MYAYGTFYDRHGEERIKFLIPDEIVNTLLEARQKGEDEYEATSDKIFEEHIKSQGVKKYIAYGGLVSAIAGTDGMPIEPLIADEEEFLIAYGYNEADVKTAYYAAEEQYHENSDDDWEE